MKKLEFSQDGVCRIELSGVPKRIEVEELVEQYVTTVEFMPYTLKMIFIDISDLVHMEARTRPVFSDFLSQASSHYGDRVDLVIAGGSINLRRYIKLFCKSIGMTERSHLFEGLEEAEAWVAHRLEIISSRQHAHDPLSHWQESV